MNHIYCFDIDGTLLSTKGAGGRSFKKAIIKIFKKEPMWKTIPMAGRLDPAIFKDIVHQIGETFSEDVWTHFKNQYLDYLKIEAEDTSNWTVFSGVKKVLEDLKSTNRYMVLLTGNIKEGAFIKLNSIGLDTYFDWDNSVFGDEGREKRDELAYVFKEKHQNGKIPVVIGDTPADVKVGKLVNGLSVAVATGMHTLEELKNDEPDYLLESLSEFPFI